MIIDEMYFIHDNLVSGFCTISNDLDHTGLAYRLHESGCVALGIARATTRTAFQWACETFVFLQNLSQTKRSTHIRFFLNIQIKTLFYQNAIR